MMPPIISLPVVDRPYLDNSILQNQDRCARLAYYNYRLNRAGIGKNYPIEFGNLYHAFRDTIEKVYMQSVLEQGKNLEEIAPKILEYGWGVATKGWVDPPIEHKKSYLDKQRAWLTCQTAFSNWLTEKRDGVIKILSTETPFDLELPGYIYCENSRSRTVTDPKEGDYVVGPSCNFKLYHSDEDYLNSFKRCPKCYGAVKRRRFAGKIDQTLEWNGRLWFRDFKTTGRNEDFNKKFNPDHQFTGYAWATSILSGRRPEGGLIEVVYNIKTKGPEFIPVYAVRTKDDIAHWLDWVHGAFEEWEMRVERDLWPMMTQGCEKYGGCFFREACNSASWFAIENWLKQKTVASSWDPLNPDVEVGLPE